jgi:DNA-binding LacI/PurR family transcriptional regulator
MVIENQYNLLVATYKSPPRKEGRPPVGPHNTDGMLVFSDSLSEDYLTQLCRNKFPLVLIHCTPPDNLKIPFVTVENKAATRKIIDHLIEVHNRRSIIFLRGPHGQEDSRWRELGYLDSLNAHGISVNPELILDGEFNGETSYRSIKNLFADDSHPHFDAIFSGNDDAAIGALTALNEIGLRVPEDVAIVGFDDLRLSSYLIPPLTTVRAPTEKVGRTAACLLFNLIKDQPADAVTLLSTEIIIRRSCGCMSETATN